MQLLSFCYRRMVEQPSFNRKSLIKMNENSALAIGFHIELYYKNYGEGCQDLLLQIWLFAKIILVVNDLVNY